MIDKSNRPLLEENVRVASSIVRQVNQAGVRRSPATLAINYSIWHQFFSPKDSPTDDGPKESRELEYLRANLLLVKRLIVESDLSEQEAEAVPQVAAVLFDSERFHVKPGGMLNPWNEAILRKQQSAYEIARSVFPGVKVLWYGRGEQRYLIAEDRWAALGYTTLKESGFGYGVAFYNMQLLSKTQEALVRTARFAIDNGVGAVTPWIALGAGYQVGATGKKEFNFNLRYDVGNSWKIGAAVGGHYEAAGVDKADVRYWKMVKNAVFFPEPFGASCDWLTQFVAYVKGGATIPLNATDRVFGKTCAALIEK